MANPKLIKKADDVFSKLVRLLYADNSGYVSCITCESKYHWKQLDNGHYIPRAHIATRYHLKNCPPQCKTCNSFNYGESKEYRAKLLEKYGEPTVLELEKLKRQTLKLSDSELKSMIKGWENQIKQLKKEKIL